TLAPTYVDGSNSVTLNLTGALPTSGLARLTVFTNTFTSNGPHDLSGVLLDGDGNGTPGGNYVRTFTIAGDSTPPTITSTTFSYVAQKPRLIVQFSEDVSTSLSASDFEITDTNSNQPLDSSRTTVSWNASNNTATLTFDGFSSAIIPDGSYRLLIRKQNVTDLSGNAMASDGTLNFFFLTADADHNATVNALDFNAIATNFGKTSATYTDGDFNYDGQVNTSDFLLLAQNFGHKLALPAPAAALSAAMPAGTIFSPFRSGKTIADTVGIDEDALI